MAREPIPLMDRNDSPGKPRKLFSHSIEEDRKISKYHLDDAAEEQADNYGYWSDLLPKQVKKVENLKVDLELMDGEKSEFYRETLDGGLDSKGNKKMPTNDAIKGAVAKDPDIVAKKRDIIDNEYLLGLVKSAIAQMDQRRSSMKVLEALDERNYWDAETRRSDEAKVNDNRVKHKNEKKQSLRGLKTDAPEEEIPEETGEEPQEEEETVPESMKDFDVSEVNYGYDPPKEGDDEGSDDGPAADSGSDSGDIAVDDVDDAAAEDQDTGEQDETPEAGSEVADAEVPEAAEEAGEEPTEEAVEEEPSGGNPCPFGHKFGEFGMHDDCDECDNESACFRKSKGN